MRFKFKQFKLTLSRLLIILAVAGAGIGLVGASAAQAAPVIRTAPLASSTSLHAAGPAATTVTFNLSVVGGCGKWKGELYGYVSGKNPEAYIQVSGTLSAGCSGTSTGRFYWSCAGGGWQQPHAPWTTKSSTGTDFITAECSGGASGYVNLYWKGPKGAGSVDSAEVSV
jgi:hypothetical protein